MKSNLTIPESLTIDVNCQLNTGLPVCGFRAGTSSNDDAHISKLPTWLKYVPFLKEIHDAKLMHKQTAELVTLICKSLLSRNDLATNFEAQGRIFGPAANDASRNGIYEIAEECMKNYPHVVWWRETEEGLNSLGLAIHYRQEKVYNLSYQMGGHGAYPKWEMMRNDETLLHVAARLAPPHRLSIVTGAALQMQRELQWFKEVEAIVQPSNKLLVNFQGYTPRMLFTEEHKDLVEKGERWMKDTASSSTVVAALIVTMAFAVVFTAPGGNDDHGTPNFLSDSVFMLFAISDAVALFSSTTSLLMFLALLTSRYAEDDFLFALPKRLAIGLLSLFVSIAATMVTFSAAFELMMRSKLSWVAAPVGLIACVPVTLFALLQFPLLVEVVLSTYGPSMFHKQNDVLLY